MARLGNTWRLAIATGGRSIACDGEDIQSRGRAVAASLRGEGEWQETPWHPRACHRPQHAASQASADGWPDLWSSVAYLSLAWHGWSGAPASRATRGGQCCQRGDGHVAPPVQRQSGWPTTSTKIKAGGFGRGGEPARQNIPWGVDRNDWVALHETACHGKPHNSPITSAPCRMFMCHYNRTRAAA